MTRVQIQTPSRLHFGLLGWGPDAPRQFGGVGLMIDAPGITLVAKPSREWSAEGPLAGRALEVAERVARQLEQAGTPLVPARIQVTHAPEEHVGLGVGTQLSLAVARALIALSGLPDPPVHSLAALCGRGLRSGIGLHGFSAGGLVVDGGRRSSEGVPPLLAHHVFPPEWSVLVVLPERIVGLHGSEELRAFAQLPPVADETTDRLCRLVLLGLLPAIVERDLETFGRALTELQERVGRCFSPAQGGVFARPELASIVAELRDLGLHGAGQSSWGPTLYAFSDEPADRRESLVIRLRDRFGFDAQSAFWTKASARGAVMDCSAH
jgi:beta-ribofuranosylaminobenzene 5'-phosphate synthase